MALLKILQYPDERLHTVAAKVPEVTDEIRTLVQNMAETMYAAPGVGLAATQVDVHQCVIVIDTSDTHDQLHVLINPEITAHSGESDYEGDRQQQPDAHHERGSQAELAGACSLSGRQLAGHDRDEDDVVDPENDLEGGQRQQRDPRFGAGEKFHVGGSQACSIEVTGGSA